MAEELKKSEYLEANGESTATTSSNQFNANFAFPIDKNLSDIIKSEDTKSGENNSSNADDSNNNSGEQLLPLLLDPPLTEEEISADLSAIINEANDLDELDMMIQSAGPFQHPRSVAQNYVGHSQANMYHRQPSYHSHHHHQVRN